MDEFIINYTIKDDKIIIYYLNSKEIVDYSREQEKNLKNKIKEQYNNIRIYDLKEIIEKCTRQYNIGFITLPSFIGLTLTIITIFTFPIIPTVIPFLCCAILFDGFLGFVTANSIFNILKINNNSKKCIKIFEKIQYLKDKDEFIKKNNSISHDLKEKNKDKASFQDIMNIPTYNHNVGNIPKTKKLNKKL